MQQNQKLICVGSRTNWGIKKIIFILLLFKIWINNNFFQQMPSKLIYYCLDFVY